MIFDEWYVTNSRWDPGSRAKPSPPAPCTGIACLRLARQGPVRCDVAGHDGDFLIEVQRFGNRIQRFCRRVACPDHHQKAGEYQGKGTKPPGTDSSDSARPRCSPAIGSATYLALRLARHDHTHPHRVPSRPISSPSIAQPGPPGKRKVPCPQATSGNVTLKPVLPSMAATPSVSTRGRQEYRLYSAAYEVDRRFAGHLDSRTARFYSDFLVMQEPQNAAVSPTESRPGGPGEGTGTSPPARHIPMESPGPTANPRVWGAQPEPYREPLILGYFRLFWQRRGLVLGGSLLPALSVALLLCLWPRQYTATFSYERSLAQSEYNVLQRRFHSQENLDKIIGRLQGAGSDPLCPAVGAGPDAAIVR